MKQPQILSLGNSCTIPSFVLGQRALSRLHAVAAIASLPVRPPSATITSLARIAAGHFHQPRDPDDIVIIPAWLPFEGAGPMGDNVYPCIVYQRLRPGAPEASRHALDHIWPLADQFVEQEGYYPCGHYGDSEYAAPFCGGSEIRPGFEAALDRARGIASKLGVCTVLVGNAAPIGDGDPFLPPLVKEDADRGVQVCLIHFPLRLHARSTSLRSAWRLFHEAQRAELAQAADRRIALSCALTEMEIAIELDHAQALARLYLTNPFPTPVSLQWKLLVRRPCSPTVLKPEPWRALVIPARHGSYLATVWKGELPWIRQLQVKHARGGVKKLGTVHFEPADMNRTGLPLIWERTG